jgi:hypothetical protein
MSKRRFVAKLEVHQLKSDEVYKDIVRIKDDSRGCLREGKIHKFSTARGSHYFILRGNEEANGSGKILMDDVSRLTMNLCRNEPYEFVIKEVGFFEELLWALRAVDPSYRVAATLGVLSFALGVLAFAPVAWGILVWAWGLLALFICR